MTPDETPRPIRAVLFDLDGTLHDRPGTVRHWLEGHTRRFGLGAGYAARFLELDDFGYRSKRLVFPQLVREFALDLAPDVLFADFDTALDHARPMPHAHEVLGALRARGLKVGIVTNGWVDAQTRCLNRCDLTGRVDDVVISRAVGLSKPDPRIYALALERLGVQAAETWFVGDSPRNDVAGPQTAGLRAAFLPTGHALNGERPDAVLRDLRDVLSLFPAP